MWKTTDDNEKELTTETENDIFKCSSCKSTTTRKKIRSKWTSIPFCKENKKEYYCGCMGWN